MRVQLLGFREIYLRACVFDLLSLHMKHRIKGILVN